MAKRLRSQARPAHREARDWPVVAAYVVLWVLAVVGLTSIVGGRW